MNPHQNRQDLLDAFARIEAVALRGAQTDVESAWSEARAVLYRPWSGLRWPGVMEHFDRIPALIGRGRRADAVRCVVAARNELFCMLSPTGPAHGPRFEGERRAGIALRVGDTVETPAGSVRIFKPEPFPHAGSAVALRDSEGRLRFMGLDALGALVRDGARVLNEDGATVLFDGLYDADRVSLLVSAPLPPR